MKRPITESVAMAVEAMPGFEHLEIVNGEWVGFDEDEYMGSEEHGRVEFKLLMRIGGFVEPLKLGMVYPGDTDFVLEGEPGWIVLKRRPDIAFVSTAKMQPTKGYFYGAPDIAVEIISPTERPNAIRKKLREYLEQGVRQVWQVWQVYPASQEIVVHFPDGSSQTYGPGEMLPGGDVLPGFTLDVAAVFEV